MALNVTTAVFGDGCNTATASPSLAQWDTEQVLQISGIELPDSYKVEFSTVYTRNAIPEIGDASGVTIPNVLLQRSAPITAYVVLYGENGGRNREYWITIYITPGQPPETITPDPEQADVIDQAIAALNNGVEAAEAAAEAIQDMGVEAETLAAGSPASVEKTVDPETGAVTLTFGIPEGDPGDPGYSPTIQIATITGGHRITVTDSQGSASFDVMDGEQGNPGTPGDDGYSPAVTITTITGGHRVTITDKTHQSGQTFDVMDGEQGNPGTPGDDGYSPAVTITTITGGHRVTITDKTHPSGQSFDVMDGVIQSVNGKSAASITLDAGDIAYDDSETYQSGSVGAELSDLSRQISDLEGVVTDPVTGLDTKAPVIINTASGAIASFDDGANGMPIKKLVAQIEPVQDLHGYDNPWPAGGGINLFDPDNFDAVSIATDGNRNGHEFSTAGTYAIKAYGSGTSAFIYARVKNSDDTWGTINYIVANTTAYEAVITITSGQVLYVYDAQVHTTDISQDFFNQWKIQVALASTQPTTYYPYSNICPISGHTGMTVARTNENMFDMSQLLLASGWTVDSDGVYSGPKGKLHEAFNKGFPVSPPFEDRTPYTLIVTAKTVDSFIRIGFRYTDGTVDYVSISTTDFETKFVRSTVSKTVKSIYATYGSNNNTKAYISQLGLYKGNTILPEDYKESQATTISITWQTEAGTVYGGTLTLNPDGTGTLVVDRELYNLASWNSDRIAAYNWNGTSGIYFSYVFATAQNRIDGLCNMARVSTTSQEPVSNAPFMWFGINTGHVYWVGILDALGIESVADFVTWLRTSGLQITRPILNPQPVQLTASEVSGILTTLYGVNNIWADTGDVEVEYPADTKLYIDNKITQAIANALNS